MNCYTFSQNLNQLLDKKSNDLQLTEAKAHMESCSKCQQKYFAMQAYMNLLKEDSDVSANPYFYTRLKQKMENMEAANKESQNVRILRPVLAVFILFLVLFNGFYFLPSISRQETAKNDLITNEMGTIDGFYLTDEQMKEIEDYLLY